MELLLAWLPHILHVMGCSDVKFMINQFHHYRVNTIISVTHHQRDDKILSEWHHHIEENIIPQSEPIGNKITLRVHHFMDNGLPVINNTHGTKLSLNCNTQRATLSLKHTISWRTNYPLVIIHRVKNYICTSHGEQIIPQYYHIENKIISVIT